MSPPAAVTSPVDEAFFALIASDPDLLRAEFDDLVDAAWDPPSDPPTDPPSGRPAPPGPGSPGFRRRERLLRGRAPDGVARPWERSPPTRQ